MRRIWPFARAQVVTVHEDGSLSVLPDNLGFHGEIRVRVGRQRAHPSASRAERPVKGDWGVIAFTADDLRSGVWLCGLDDDLRNFVPTELWQADPYASLDHHHSDSTVIRHGDGSVELVLPDETLIRITTRKDGSLSNASGRAAKTQLRRRVKTGPGESERQDYARKAQPPVDVHVAHSSGSSVSLTADGSVHAQTARGHRMRLHDGTEKVRSSESGDVTATPEEDAQRVNSEIVLETELGLKVTMHDDPILEADRYLKLETPLGNQVEARDKPDALRGIKAQTVDGFALELLDVARTAELKTPAGRRVKLDDLASKTTVSDPVLVVIDAPLTDLSGAGGEGVARVGDQVEVVIPSGSSAGTYIGAIISGSLKTKSQ